MRKQQKKMTKQKETNLKVGDIAETIEAVHTYTHRYFK